MSKLNDLISQLCPDGVEYLPLGNVCKFEKGKQLNKNDLFDEGLYPVINGGVSPSGYWNEFNFNENLITISQGGASAGYVNFIETPFWAGAHCFVVNEWSKNINYRYLYHFLKENEKRLMQGQQGAGIPSVSLKDINNLQIPVPPLEVQSEIVRILDNFTELTAELTAELTVRKKQYEYYKTFLLSQGKKYKLSSIALMPNERINVCKLDKNNYVGVDNLLPNCAGKKSSEHIPTTGTAIQYNVKDVLIGNIRPYLKKIWFANNTGGTNGDVLIIRSKDENVIIPKFLFYALSTNHFFDYDNGKSKGSKMPRGDKKAILNYVLNVPPLKEQERIVSILDRFDALCNDITEGLPAEIEARQKQYEYYRNKLLTFTRKEN